MSTQTPTHAGRAERTDPSERTAPSFVDSVGLIAGREIRMRVRSKAFLWSTGVLMLAVHASVILGSVFGAQDSTTKVAVVAGASAVVDGNEALEPVAASSWPGSSRGSRRSRSAARPVRDAARAA